eukprot:Blabericola_migrator_1__709@NODE_1176_length_5208_cov_319_797899_g799_i0_p2_GENE_NODE_1176_length_5208_cov_319_797899_g799_i0NODE_1176_length_5208_cov_319_797899_g799_i0_p2_ORF_typecomplete_len591_score77_18_NODE_1176_length_5208_cov_319_797899_g799_i04552227
MVCSRSIQFDEGIKVKTQLALGLLSILPSDVGINEIQAGTSHNTPEGIDDDISAAASHVLEGVPAETYEILAQALEACRRDLARNGKDTRLADFEQFAENACIDGKTLQEGIRDTAVWVLKAGASMARTAGFASLLAALRGTWAKSIPESYVSNDIEQSYLVNAESETVVQATSKAFTKAFIEALSKHEALGTVTPEAEEDSTATQSLIGSFVTHGKPLLDRCLDWAADHPIVSSGGFTIAFTLPLAVWLGTHYGLRFGQGYMATPVTISDSRGRSYSVYRSPPHGYDVPEAVRRICKKPGDPQTLVTQVLFKKSGGALQWYDLPRTEKVVTDGEMALAGFCYRIVDGKLQALPTDNRGKGRALYCKPLLDRRELNIFASTDSQIQKDLLMAEYMAIMDEPVLTEPAEGTAVPTAVWFQPDGVCQVWLKGKWYPTNTPGAKRPLFHMSNKQIIEGPAFRMDNDRVLMADGVAVPRYRVLYTAAVMEGGANNIQPQEMIQQPQQIGSFLPAPMPAPFMMPMPFPPPPPLVNMIPAGWPINPPIVPIHGETPNVSTPLIQERCQTQPSATPRLYPDLSKIPEQFEPLLPHNP